MIGAVETKRAARAARYSTIKRRNLYPCQVRCIVVSIRTAATPKQTAAPHATVKSDIHMSRSLSFRFGLSTNAATTVLVSWNFGELGGKIKPLV